MNVQVECLRLCIVPLVATVFTGERTRTGDMGLGGYPFICCLIAKGGLFIFTCRGGFRVAAVVVGNGDDEFGFACSCGEVVPTVSASPSPPSPSPSPAWEKSTSA